MECKVQLGNLVKLGNNPSITPKSESIRTVENDLRVEVGLHMDFVSCDDAAVDLQTELEASDVRGSDMTRTVIRHQ